MRLLTANLANGGADPAGFALLVASLAPDAVAVQELGLEQAEALARVLPHGSLEPARDHSGMGIALARPGIVRRLSLPYRDGRVAELAPVESGPAGEPIEILNVHIRAPHLGPLWRSLRVRRAQVRALVAYLDATPRRRRALLGDLNATPLWPVYRRLAGRLSDCCLVAARGGGARPARTWGPWPGGPRLLRIDHALVCGLTVIETRTCALAGSDHDALVVDLAVPTRSKAEGDAD